MIARDDGRFDAWVDQARAVTCRQELERRGAWTRRMLGDAGVPCPGCGGTDRFAVNLRKDLWTCRKSGAGGDAIALVRHLDGCSFVVACEILTGEPPPTGVGETADERASRTRRLEARAAEAAEEARRQQEDGEKFRRWEREAARRLYDTGRPIRDTVAEHYLALRGLPAPTEARLRFHPAVQYFASGKEHGGPLDRPRPIYSGPAMLAPILDAGGRFIGVHRTWIDLGQPDGKAVICDGDGVILPAKKVRGSKRGGTIRLAGHPRAVGEARDARTVIMGEGIETTLSAYAALPPAERAGVEFHASVDLGNMAGKADGQVPHPTLLRAPDARGRVKRLRVPSGVPAADDDTPMIGLPDGVTELILLGDGDSEPFATGLAMRRAGTRFAEAYPGVTVRLAKARPGMDFNTMLREAA